MSVGSDLEGTAEIRVAIMQSGEQLEIATVRGKNSNSFQISRFNLCSTLTSRVTFTLAVCVIIYAKIHFVY